MFSELISYFIVSILIIFNSLIITYFSNYFNKYYGHKNFFKMTSTLIVLNSVPVVSMQFLLFGITNSLRITFLIVSLFIYILSLVNYFKIYYREEPMYISDLKLLLESLNMAGEYSISLTLEMVAIFVVLIIYTAIIGLFPLNSGPVFRILFITIAIISIYSILNNRYFCLSKFYNRITEDFDEDNWSESDNYQYHGFVYPLLFTLNSILSMGVSSYESQYAYSALEEYSGGIKQNDNINFMTLMLESFTYFGNDNIKWDIYPYENFDKILENSISGNLITNVFGGGTVDTENSFLTGISAKLSSKKTYNSFIEDFRTKGYNTVAMHPNDGWFYNRSKFYKGIGFTDFLDRDSLKIKKNDAQNDAIFINEYIQTCNKYLSNKNPMYAFGITFQNHGPYSDEYIKENQFISNPSKNRDINIFNNYIEGIHRTDKELKRIFEFIESKNKPIILTIFGDHRPWIGFEGKGYSKLGIDVSRNKVEGFINFYSTPYIIYANSAAKLNLNKTFIGKNDDYLSPNMLFPETLKYLGYKTNIYGNYLMKFSNSISMISNKYIVIDKRFVKVGPRTERLLNEYNILQKFWMKEGDKYD